MKSNSVSGYKRVHGSGHPEGETVGATVTTTAFKAGVLKVKSPY